MTEPQMEESSSGEDMNACNDRSNEEIDDKNLNGSSIKNFNDN